jgi:hypothetical protein
MAVKQFLLNPDGSIPAGANIAALLEAGVPLVLPTPRWRPADGMTLEEREPQRDEQGVWRQVWVEVAVPPPSDVAIDEPV